MSLLYNSELIPTEFGSAVGTDPAAHVEAAERSDVVMLTFHARDRVGGEFRHEGVGYGLSWGAARRLSRVLWEATEAITDAAGRELDEQLAKHPHVSARWLGEMGREQRSN